MAFERAGEMCKDAISLNKQPWIGSPTLLGIPVNPPHNLSVTLSIKISWYPSLLAISVALKS
jgi:hypothetical protein